MPLSVPLLVVGASESRSQQLGARGRKAAGRGPGLSLVRVVHRAGSRCEQRPVTSQLARGLYDVETISPAIGVWRPREPGRKSLQRIWRQKRFSIWGSEVSPASRRERRAEGASARPVAFKEATAGSGPFSARLRPGVDRNRSTRSFERLTMPPSLNGPHLRRPDGGGGHLRRRGVAWGLERRDHDG